MRAIDGDALIDDLKHDVAIDQDSLDYEELTDSNREKIQFDKDCKQNIIDLLRNVPTIEPEQRWIPCSERLPDEEVLCCDTRGEMIIGYPYPEESNTGFSAESDDVFMIDCAAWMPLPEPYAERLENEVL